MVSMRKIVVPGTVVSDHRLSMDNTYVDGTRTVSAVVGLFDDSRNEVIPLEGFWKPRSGDIVVGVVEAAGRNGTYKVVLTEFVNGLIIQDKYDREHYMPGDIIEAKVRDIEHKVLAVLEEPRRLEGGTLMNVKAVKVPRLIGKANTMIKQIMDLTKCSMVVGRNGLVWMKGQGVAEATEAVLRIEHEAHTSGLTERIKSMLEKGKNRNT